MRNTHKLGFILLFSYILCGANSTLFAQNSKKKPAQQKSKSIRGNTQVDPISAKGYAELPPNNDPNYKIENLAQYVNPFIGTGGHGHTFPGAVMPFGMVQLSPDTRTDASWDGCGGYYYNDAYIYGFSHTHLSGTGVSDYGDVLFQPMSGSSSFDPKKYRSLFNHVSEEAKPGYYRVMLTQPQIAVELTATNRVGFHKYTFQNNNSDSMFVVIDLEHRDQLLSHNLDVNIGSTKVKGFRQSKAWANNQWVYFTANFSLPVLSVRYNAKKSIAILYFGQTLGYNKQDKVKTNEIFCNVGISFTSQDGAQRNNQVEIDYYLRKMDAEGHSLSAYEKKVNATSANVEVMARSNFYNHWFKEVQQNAEDAWNKELNKINIPNKNNEVKNDDLVKFYSALYHCMIHPSLSSDVDFQYRGRDQKIHYSNGNIYSVFSLWDTYRALHPLMSIIDKQRTADFINSFLNQYKQGGRLPVWELGSCETDCMIGYHSVSVIADAIMKGIPGIDIPLAIEAMRHSSDLKEEKYMYANPSISNALKLPKFKLGYIDVKNDAESVSKTLENAYDDWCISRVLFQEKKDSIAQIYLRRSERWKNMLDPETHFMRPRVNGEWLSPFDPREVNNHFTEANSWQYSFYVPHDIKTFTNILGGESKLEQHLDSLFHTSSKTTGREQSDISGLIGQYAHGNEPSHHMAYLYNYCKKPEKTQAILEKIWNEFYTTKPDGLIGNEDCGQMSAWAVMTAMGIYQVAPASNEYSLGMPMFPQIEVRFEDNHVLKITRDNVPDYMGGKIADATGSTEGRFLVSDINNGAGKGEYKNRLKHSELLDYPFIRFAYLPNMVKVKITNNYFKFDFSEAQTHNHDHLPKAVRTQTVLPLPTIIGTRMFEDDNQQILVIANPDYHKLISDKAFTEIHVKNLVTDKVESFATTLDTFKLEIKDNSVVWVGSYDRVGDKPQEFTAAYFVRKPNNYKVVSIAGKYNKQYTGGGDEALINGVLGATEWRAGDWQGYQDQDFEAVIDLGKPTELTSIGARFLQDSRAWILFPKDAEFFVSNDGQKFESVAKIISPVVDTMEQTVALPFETLIPKKTARYVKVKATNYGKLPTWHLGYPYGGTAFIFIDEILINPPIEIPLKK